jgi:hypothetical protein
MPDEVRSDTALAEAASGQSRPRPADWVVAYWRRPGAPDADAWVMADMTHAAFVAELGPAVAPHLGDAAPLTPEEAAMSAEIDAILARLDEGIPRLMQAMDEIRDRLRRPLAL